MQITYAIPTRSSLSPFPSPSDQDFPIVQIRPATTEDIPALIAVERACITAAHWSVDQYRDAFRVEQGSRRLLLAAHSEDGLLVGFLVAQNVASDWELENIVVTLTEQGKGIGRSLLRNLVDAARQGGGHSIFLEVRKSNEAARRFYERSGFRQAGLRRGYYSSPCEDAILYQLNLQ